MKNHAYDFELEKIKRLVREKGARRVGLQLPEGLKTVATELAAEISGAAGTEAGAEEVEVLISGNSCFGACDVDERLERVVDLLFHFGHTFSFQKRKPVLKEKEKTPEKVVFVELRSSADLKPAVEKAVAAIKGEVVGLVATVQHAHALKEAEEVLARFGKKAEIRKSRNLKYEGQVLGCDFSAAVGSACEDCEEVLFVGTGSFHPTGLALYTGKRVVAADPFTEQVSVFEPEELRKRRWLEIARALDARSFGIILSLKSGQFNQEAAVSLRRRAAERGLKAFLLAFDEVSEERLLGFKTQVDAFVNTACPRLAEDFVHFEKPFLSAAEFEVVLGEREWDAIF